jgi:hypothetical protein
MEASLTYYPTVQVLSRSDKPGQCYDAKSVPLYLVRSVRLCHSYSVTRNLVRVSRQRYRKPMPTGHALCKLDSRTIQRYWSYRDRTNLDKVTTRKVYLCVWYAASDCAIVTALSVSWCAQLVNGTKNPWLYGRWTHILYNGTGPIAIGPTWTMLPREKCTSVSGSQCPTVS